MIQVWMYDENKVFIESTFVEEVERNMTTTPLLIGYIKPTFKESNKEWFEGATEQEIKEWQEANKPQPKPEPEPEPDKFSILQDQVTALEEENMTLSEYVLGLEMKSLEQEETVIMTNEYVLDLDMRLTNIETK